MDLERRLQELAELAGRIAAEHGAAATARIRATVEQALHGAAPIAAASDGALRPAVPADRARYDEIIGESPSILAVLATLDRVADSPLAVLIQGESGTGKELIARAIHRHSSRRAAPFVTENCAAIPETLQESELFGYKRGAFTGADRERKGLFEVADKGTLFLDEVGDMSLGMQKKLLRALQDGEIRPVGATRSVHVDVRLISASNRRLRDMVAQKTFREDLFYRINGVTIELPALRERREDVPALLDHFLTRFSKESGRAPPEVRPEARDALVRYRWPGNIRELENEVRRALALLGTADVIDLAALSDEVRGAR